MDKIIINGLKVFAFHGVNPEEKIDGQRFVIDCELTLDMSKACETDKVSDTVSYATVMRLIEKVMKERSYDLIEAVASRVCEAIFEEFKMIKEIEITLKKPFAPVKLDFDYVAVTLTRKRPLFTDIEPV